MELSTETELVILKIRGDDLDSQTNDQISESDS